MPKILGLDMGGSNLDGVVLEDGRLTKRLKTPVNPADLSATVARSLATLVEGEDPQSWTRIHLSTTHTTNCIATGSMRPVTLILQEGPGLREDYAEEGVEIFKLPGAVDHRGIITAQVPRQEIRSLGEKLDPEHFAQLAVVTKFSTRNPEIELALGESFGDHFESLTLGHRLAGALNFPRRVRTARLNAGVFPVFRAFADAVEENLRGFGITAPVYILKADAGTLALSQARQMPVQSILSGPAASFLGLAALGSGFAGDGVLMDIGGTTTDLFYIADGEPLFEREGATIDGRKTLVRALYTDTLALGGDSRLRWVDGALRIGPERAATPPTLSDAFRVLGKLEDGGELAPFGELAREAGMSARDFAARCLAQAARTIRQRVDQTLEALHKRPLYTVREVLEDRRLEPRYWQVIGGPAQSMKPILEEVAGVPVLVPQCSEVANAIGAALARPTQVLTLRADTEAGVLRIPELGVYEKTPRGYDLPDAKARLLRELNAIVEREGLREDEDIEITEESRFLMLDGMRQGLNLRLAGQIRPGLLDVDLDLSDDSDDSPDPDHSGATDQTQEATETEDPHAR